MSGSRRHSSIILRYFFSLDTSEVCNMLAMLVLWALGTYWNALLLSEEWRWCQSYRLVNRPPCHDRNELVMHQLGGFLETVRLVDMVWILSSKCRLVVHCCGNKRHLPISLKTTIKQQTIATTTIIAPIIYHRRSRPARHGCMGRMDRERMLRLYLIYFSSHKTLGYQSVQKIYSLQIYLLDLSWRFE